VIGPRHARLLLLIATGVAGLALSGCTLLGSPAKATISPADLKAAFPTIERLASVVYSHDPEGDAVAECEYFEYGRGAFTSDPANASCRVFDPEDRHPGGGAEGPVPVAFDDQARADLADLKRTFEGADAPLDYMNLVLGADGSVGPDSTFAFDPCVTYVYQPGWSTLPGDEDGDTVSTGIDADWYKTDSCP
jgi:hypothetical protein